MRPRSRQTIRKRAQSVWLSPNTRMGVAAEAAATAGRFWEMHDILFEHQRTLDEGHLVGFARRLDLGEDLIRSALEGAYDTKIQSDFSGGVHSGVNGTPCLFINGERWEGPATAAALLSALE